MDENDKREENMEINKEEPAKVAEVVEEPKAGSTAKEPVKNRKGLAIAAMVLGIVSIVFFCVWYISITCAVLAIIFGILSLKSTRRGMAIAGISTGAVGFVLMVILYIFIFFVIGVGTYSGLKDAIEYYEDHNSNYNYRYNRYDNHNYYDDYDDYDDWF